jgi:nitrite reductase (NO-forming)
MAANNGSNDPSVWPSLVTSLVVLAVVVSVLSLGVVIDRSHESSGATGVADTTVAGPGFTFGGDPPEAFKARDPNAPKASTATAPTVHKVTFDIEEKQIEIAPGVSQLMWTYNGQVPGPILRGNVGDTFEVTLVNHGAMSHSIDFHASEVAPNVAMRIIGPNQTLVYKFIATHAGIYLYHCGTPPIVEHMAMGMYGAVIIDPPNLQPVAHEYVFVQSELYRESDPTQPVDYNKLIAARWDAVVFNGYVSQYADRPIPVQANQKIRVWVIDAGPSDISSFHVIGTIFDTVYKEGEYLLRPGSGEGGSQTLDLAPAQGGFVEFSLHVRGEYPFITHKISDAMQGASGVFHATSAT